METSFTPFASAAGGALIGASAVWLMATTGRIAGISGIVARLIAGDASARTTRLAFVLGLLAAMPLVVAVTGQTPAHELAASPALLAIAGGLVGYGSARGSGCTSGHGVCGISRLSQRSMVATATFMATAALAVFVARHLLGGG